ncbi:MAG: tetratricopeptide repeat protein [Candidatus Latescibacterota bacterium]
MTSAALGGCASAAQPEPQPDAQFRAEMLARVEALTRAVDASYDRERSMAERLRQAEEANERLREELEMLRQRHSATRAYLDSLEQVVASQPAVPPLARHRAAPDTTSDVYALYSQALERFTNRQYEAALEGFSAVLDLTPYGEWADNAQFWKGECHWGLRQYRQALAEFTKVSAYPRSEKHDDAQLKIARCYAALGENGKAADAFQKLLEEYPHSEFADMARREIRLMRRHGTTE